MKIDKINVRAYAACIQDDKILVLDEYYAGTPLVKFPGGGLELGESLTECLKREFMEELNLEIEVKNHLYTQDDFLASRFRTNEQLLTVYYHVNILNIENLRIVDPSIQSVNWISLTQKNPMVLPMDIRVYDMLQEKFLQGLI